MLAVFVTMSIETGNTTIEHTLMEAQNAQAMVEDIIRGGDKETLDELAVLLTPALMGDAALLRKVELRRQEFLRLRENRDVKAGDENDGEEDFAEKADAVVEVNEVERRADEGKEKTEGESTAATAEAAAGVEADATKGEIEGSDSLNVKALGRDLEAAAALQEAGEFLAAKQKYEEVLVEYQKVLGEDHADLATIHNILGIVAKNQGEHKEAKAHYQKAIKILESKPGEEIKSAVTYHNLGAVADDQGEYEEAKAYYQEALKRKASWLGDDHIDAAVTYNNLGIVAYRQDQHEEANACFQKALTIQVSNVGEDHLDVASTYNNLGDVADAQEEYEEAKAYYQKAKQYHPVRCHHKPPAHGDVL